MENNIICFSALRKPMFTQFSEARLGKAAGFTGSVCRDRSMVSAAAWTYRIGDDSFFWTDNEDTIHFLEEFGDDDEVICVENKLISLVTGKKKRF